MLDQNILNDISTKFSEVAAAIGRNSTIGLVPGEHLREFQAIAYAMRIKTVNYDLTAPDCAPPPQAVVLTGLSTLNRDVQAVVQAAIKAGRKTFIADSCLDPLIRRQTGKPQIRFDTTNSCNLRCSYCYRRADFPKANPHMPLEIYRSLHGLKPLEAVETFRWDEESEIFTSTEDFRAMIDNIGEPELLALSCACEPLIHPRIRTFLEYSSGLNTLLVTNGLLLNEVLARSMIRNGLGVLAVSLDSTDDAFTRKHTGIRASKVLEKLRLVGRMKRELGSTLPCLTVSMVLFDENMGHVEELLRVLARLGVEGLGINRLLPRNNEFKAMVPPNRKIAELVERLTPVSQETGIPVNFGYQDTPRTERVDGICPMPFTYFYVNASGDIVTCFRKTIGNIFRESLDTAIERNMPALLQAVHLKDVYCRHCFI